MARRDKPVSDGAKVREYLLRIQAALLAGLVGVDWPPRGLHGCLNEIVERDDLPPVPTFTDVRLDDDDPRRGFVAGVRALASGGAYTFSRSDLPAWHPACRAGASHDQLTLTAHDELIDEQR